MPLHGIRRWSPLFALLVLASLFGTAVGRGTVRAAPVRDIGQTDAVISEFRTRGPAGSNDEFVEIFNPSNSVINIGGWKIISSDNLGSTGIPYVITGGTTLQPGEHFLITNNGAGGYSGTVTGDGTYDASIPDDGGLALLRADDSIADQVGMSIGSAFKESPLLTPMNVDAEQSYERKPGGASGSCYDSNNNAFDFVFNPSSSDPQNHSASLPTVCALPTATPPIPTATYTPTPSNTPVPTDTPTATLTPTNTFTPTNTYTPTGTYTPVAPPHIVISEFRSTGPLGAGDEFVEVFNATGATTNIGGWSVKKSTGCGSTVSTLFLFPLNTILAPGQHYLAAATGSTYATTADFKFASGLVDTGGIALVSSTGALVDAAGMCTTTTYREGAPLAPLSGTTNQSYERRPGGAAGGCYDLDNNATDFNHISPASPMKSTDAKVMCTGVILASPTATATPTRSPTPSRVPTSIPGIIVINEILPHPASDWNGDGVINYNDEYIEIFNAGQEEYTLSNWTLTDSSGTPIFVIPKVTLLPQQVLVLFHTQTGISLSDGGDGVFLYRNSGVTNDALTYPVVESADRTWCRLPDGRGNWTFGCWPSPGKPNSWLGASVPTPPAEKSTCPLADVVPSIIQYPECGSPGDSIRGSGFWKGGEFWLKTRYKDVYIE